jgi:hypothetical protein
MQITTQVRMEKMNNQRATLKIPQISIVVTKG